MSTKRKHARLTEKLFCCSEPMAVNAEAAERNISVLIVAVMLKARTEDRNVKDPATAKA